MMIGLQISSFKVLGQIWGSFIQFIWIGSFMSIPSFLIVVAFSGLTYAKKDKYDSYELGAVLKQDMILGRWIGTIIGMILMFNFAYNDITTNFGVCNCVVC